MNWKNLSIIAIVLLFCVSVLPSEAAITEEEQKLRDAIYSTYGITIYDYAENGGTKFTASYLKAMIEVFEDMPADFTSCTRAIFMDASAEQFEIKYRFYWYGGFYSRS